MTYGSLPIPKCLLLALVRALPRTEAHALTHTHAHIRIHTCKDSHIPTHTHTHKPLMHTQYAQLPSPPLSNPYDLAATRPVLVATLVAAICPLLQPFFSPPLPHPNLQSVAKRRTLAIQYSGKHSLRSCPFGLMIVRETIVCVCVCVCV